MTSDVFFYFPPPVVFNSINKNKVLSRLNIINPAKRICIHSFSSWWRLQFLIHNSARPEDTGVSAGLRFMQTVHRLEEAWAQGPGRRGSQVSMQESGLGSRRCWGGAGGAGGGAAAYICLTMVVKAEWLLVLWGTCWAWFCCFRPLCTQ